ncbi:hypothetical protein [Alteraurantiacibacter aestuarii]|uniref:Uncharacterized protein n=1 Tax=Alteraurantiacibacter aestuarii TaxID=650004 RepID=A0A844ZN92_9SPHN|nr:hypothetical protein [Alteraurantiacibacter aestuarii]MXO88500.1 hypothetical protein [Alteraurantiacibacter aestuarii]
MAPFAVVVSAVTIGAQMLYDGWQTRKLETENAAGIERTRVFVGQAQACYNTICVAGFPENAACRQAMGLLGGSAFISPADSVNNLQGRIALFRAYSKWLEGRAGVSAMGHSVCGQDVEYFHPFDDAADLRLQ